MADSLSRFTPPDWPAVMRASTAAAYLDLSRSAFLKHIAPDLPKVRITAAIVAYRRSDLDRWVASKGECPLPAPANDLEGAIDAEREEWNGAFGPG